MIDFVIKVDLFKSMYLVCDLIKVVNIQSIFLCTEIGSTNAYLCWKNFRDYLCAFLYSISDVDKSQ